MRDELRYLIGSSSRNPLGIYPVNYLRHACVSPNNYKVEPASKVSAKDRRIDSAAPRAQRRDLRSPYASREGQDLFSSSFFYVQRNVEVEKLLSPGLDA
jgi:hypothetical protein